MPTLRKRTLRTNKRFGFLARFGRNQHHQSLAGPNQRYAICARTRAKGCLERSLQSGSGFAEEGPGETLNPKSKPIGVYLNWGISEGLGSLQDFDRVGVKGFKGSRVQGLRLGPGLWMRLWGFGFQAFGCQDLKTLCRGLVVWGLSFRGYPKGPKDRIIRYFGCR